MEGKDFVATVPSISVEVTASRLTSDFRVYLWLYG